MKYGIYLYWRHPSLSGLHHIKMKISVCRSGLVFMYHTQLIFHLGLLASLCEIIGSLVGSGGSLYGVDTIGGPSVWSNST